MIRAYYRCCCINEPVVFSHCVQLKRGHRFHALLKVCSDRDDIAPLRILSFPCELWICWPIHLISLLTLGQPRFIVCFSQHYICLSLPHHVIIVIILISFAGHKKIKSHHVELHKLKKKQTKDKEEVRLQKYQNLYRVRRCNGDIVAVVRKSSRHF